jgi:hypothetical protein
MRRAIFYKFFLKWCKYVGSSFAGKWKFGNKDSVE